MRKEADFEVMDQIKVFYQGAEKVGHIFAENCDTIKKEVLATEITAGDPQGEYNKEWNINGEKVTLGVSKQ